MVSFSRVEKIALDRLVIGGRQVRTREVEEDIDELVDNIRVHGQLEPVIVAPLDDLDGHYEILAGQRRWLAMRRLGAREITAAVIDERPDHDVASALSISENLIRRDLSVLDLIDACTSLYNRYGSIKAVAERFGLPYGRVRRYVKFDRLRPELKELVKDGAIDLKTAIKLEDHCQRGDVDERQLRRLAAEVAGMSMAQQSDFFSAGEETGRAPHKPGSVKQIIVTLTLADLEALRAWARTKNLTQDRAGARIIASFLRDLARGVPRNA